MCKTFKPDNSWTLFLDRDGVINKRLNDDYVKTTEEFVFINGVPENLKVLSRAFGKIIIVTNQQGIGKGIMSEDDLSRIHNYMCEQIEKAGGRIDKIYHCPDLNDTGSKNRKPEAGMGLQAQIDFPVVDFSKSVMVGDTLTDMEFGKKLGMFTVLISENINYFRSLCVENNLWDIHFSSLNEFTDWILKKEIV